MGWKQDLNNIWSSITSRNRFAVTSVERNIIKSEGDMRKYRGLTLGNGLRVLLVSDPTTDKAAAALDVYVGHLVDPDDLPGLAHLCEHMLFMGTKKSTDVDEYKRFLSEHGGSSNAFTSMEHTNYHFDISVENLQPALKKFSKFIREPQFDSHVIEREINVIDAENNRNLSNDQWRLFQLGKSTADPTHPYSKFGTGNKSTLLTTPKDKGINVYKRLLSFHKKYYSATIMCLVVLGKESLDELESIVIPLFAGVQNGPVETPVSERPPYRKSDLKVQLNVVPLKNMQNMLLTFPINDLMPVYKIKPGHYVGYLMSFQGEGSLFAELKAKGWINNLVAANKHGAKGFMFFCISMSLTEEGFENTDAIIGFVFQYISMLKQIGVEERMYKECNAFKALRFRFKEKEPPRDYVSDVAETLPLFTFPDCLCGPWLLFEYNEKEIKSLLDKMNPDNIRVIVQSKKFDGETDLVEQWYGTHYSMHQIPKQTIEEWKAISGPGRFHLPQVNEYIPTDLQLTPRDKNNPRHPGLLHESEGARLWYHQDNHYLLPKTCITVLFTSPDVYRHAGDVAALEIGMETLSDHLQPMVQPAEWAGLFVDVFSTVNGITLAINGYSDKMDVLLERVVQSMVTFKLNPERYGPIKEQYMQALSNFEMEQAHWQAIHLISVVVSTLSWTKAEIQTAAKDVTLDMVQDCLVNFLSKMHIEMLVYGNITQKSALRYLDIVSSILSCEAGMKPISKDEHRQRLQEVKLEKGFILYKHVSTAVRETKGVAFYFQCGPQSTRLNVTLELFFYLTHQHCYDILRTRDQLGYIVVYNIRRTKGILGLRIAVQSQYGVGYIHAKILEFIKDLEDYLKKITPERFLNQRTVLRNQHLERPKRMGEQNARYWTEITTNTYRFNKDMQEAAEALTITLDDVLKFYKDYIRPGGEHQRSVVVHIAPESVHSETSVDDLKQVLEVDHLSEYKKASTSYPSAEPVPPISSGSYTVKANNQP